jgi:hypothetical protein
MLGVIGTGTLVFAGGFTVSLLIWRIRAALRKRAESEKCPYCGELLNADDVPKTTLDDRETRAHSACHAAAEWRD